MEAIVLNGRDLTLEQVWQVAHEGCPVEIAPEGYTRIAESRNIMAELAAGGKAIYGFNRGVGWNKDRPFDEDFMAEYNRKLMASHTLGVAPYHTEEEVRAMLVIRLNCALGGAGCATDELVNRYRDFLNHGISPLVPKRGSVGDADITTLSHIGMAFIGESDVYYRGEVIGADKAIEAEGLPEYRLAMKDAHTIILSNSQGESMAALLLKEAEDLLSVINLIYCLDYEGLNGNIEAMSEEVNAIRGLPGQIESAAQCRHFLEGSYLNEPHPGRALQDSLTFRGGFAIHSLMTDALEYLRGKLAIAINSTSDNPCVIAGKREVRVTSNFEEGAISMAVEMLAIAMSHVSKTITYRMIKMTDPGFTGLTRYLAPWNDSSFGYATIQNTYTALDVENRSLANPCSMDFYPMEGMIEDHGSNLPLAADHARKMLDNLRYLTGIEGLYAAQAIDLRREKDPDIHLGRYTQIAYDCIRETVPFLGEDRNMHREINTIYDLIASGEILRRVKAAEAE